MRWGLRGLQRVADDRCQMRPVGDAAVAVQPGKDATAGCPSGI